jgi:hypothetical protein
MKWWKLTVLIHGGAKGADTLADQWGRQNKLIVYEFKADWEGLGKSAGIIRNVDMLNQYPDVVIAFQGGRGTEHMIKISREAAIPVFLP